MDFYNKFKDTYNDFESQLQILNNNSEKEEISEKETYNDDDITITPWISIKNVHVPEEDLNYLYEESYTNLTDENKDLDTVLLLTGLVRHEYLSYLERLLTVNYEACCVRAKTYINNAPVPPPLPVNVTRLKIKQYAEYLEQKALKSCMLVALYRKSMLKIIDEIRKETVEFKLNNIFNGYSINAESSQIRLQKDVKNVNTQTSNCKCYKKRRLHNIRTQTVHEYHHHAQYENDQHLQKYNMLPSVRNTKIVNEKHSDNAEGHSQPLTLDEKIKIFEKKLNDDERKHKPFHHSLNKKYDEELKLKKIKINENMFCNKNTEIPLLIQELTSPLPPLTNDLITPTTPIITTTTTAVFTPPIALLQPIENNIYTSHTEDSIAKELNEIFGFDDDDIESINKKVTNSPTTVKTITPENFIEIQTNDTNYMNFDNNTHENFISKSENDNINGKEDEQYRDELKDSLWPCELHMRNIKLHKILEQVACKGIRHLEKIHKKFKLLFGLVDGYENADAIDFDDDFGPYSPSLELNEILISSCKKRIAPWIVKYLMKPMKEGRILNRYLFKKLAKYIADRIIMEDQYPEEHVIKLVVDDYFALHNCVRTINDIYEQLINN